jgi:hypothetical protein
MEIKQTVLNPFGAREEFGNGDGNWVLGGGIIGGSTQSIENIQPIVDTSALAFSYVAIPGGQRTLLNLLQSYGVNEFSQNDGSTQWNNSFSGDLLYVANPITTIDYFSRTNRAQIVKGDGSNDSFDWTVFYFDVEDNVSDYDGRAGSLSFFGGEYYPSGGLGGHGVNTGRIWGFSSSKGWTLLYQLPLGSDQSFNHQNTNWWNAGNTVTGGNGKRSEYDSLQITHIGFSVEYDPDL